MKNLLVIAVLGLLLGAGAWKLQNPNGTLEDLRQQSLVLSERLRDGVEAVALSDGASESATTERLQSLESRLAAIESDSLEAPESGLATQLAALNDAIDARQQSFDDQLQATGDRLSNLALRIDTLGAERLSADNEGENASSTDTDALMARLDERFSALETRLSAVDVGERRLAALSDQLQANRDEISTLQSTLQSLNASQDDIAASLAQAAEKSDTAAAPVTLEAVREEITRQLADITLRESAQEADGTEGPVASDESVNTDDEAGTPADTVGADPLVDTTEPPDRNLVTREQVRALRESGAVEYKIYFDWDSVAISDAAATVLDSFIAQEQNRTTGVSIFGFTDSAGPAVYNQQLAQQRAANVRRYLIDRDFDADRIKALNGLGEAAAAELVPADADSAQQRVVVLFAAQP